MVEYSKTSTILTVKNNEPHDNFAISSQVVQHKPNIKIHKTSNRQQSITRGTASSMAKIVRAPQKMNEPLTPPQTPSPPSIIKRKLSFTGNALMTEEPLENKQKLFIDSVQHRRSSWSSISSSSTSTVSSVPLRQKLSSPESSISSLSSSHTFDKHNVKKSLSNIKVYKTNLNNATPDDKFVKISSNKNKNTTILTKKQSDNKQKNHQMIQQNRNSLNIAKKKSTNLKTNNTSSNDAKSNNKSPVNDNATITAGNQQKISSPTFIEKFNSPENFASELIYIEKNPSNTINSTKIFHHHHHHHHHYTKDSIPRYMRRSVCSACSRNIKITSNSESTAQQHNSNINSNNRRRSSFSTYITAKSQHSSSERYHYDGCKENSITTIDEMLPTISISITSNISSASSINDKRTSIIGSSDGHSIKYMPSHPQNKALSKSKSSKSLILNKNKSNLTLKKSTIPSKKQNNNSNQCSQPLCQQQPISTLDIINGMNQDLMVIKNNSNLYDKHYEKYETILLETQESLLEKITEIVSLQEDDEMLYLQPSSSSTIHSIAYSENDEDEDQDILSSSSEQDNLMDLYEDATNVTGNTGVLSKFSLNLSQWIDSIIEIEEFDDILTTKTTTAGDQCKDIWHVDILERLW